MLEKRTRKFKSRLNYFRWSYAIQKPLNITHIVRTVFSRQAWNTELFNFSKDVFWTFSSFLSLLKSKVSSASFFYPTFFQANTRWRYVHYKDPKGELKRLISWTRGLLIGKNSWPFAMPSLVSHNDVWRASAEILYWWCVTSLILVV